MKKLTRDQLLLELMEFFLESLDASPTETMDWLVQGDFDADQFVDAVRSLRSILLGDEA